jgi:hypothetical protein
VSLSVCSLSAVPSTPIVASQRQKYRATRPASAAEMTPYPPILFSRRQVLEVHGRAQSRRDALSTLDSDLIARVR